MDDWKHKFDGTLKKILTIIESVVAVVVTVVLVAVLAVAVFRMLSEPTALLEEEYLAEFLHNMLNIVVGLEFVKLLMHVTPENVLEVLIMAVARHFVVGSGSASENLLNVVCIMLCITGTIAIRMLRMTDRDLDKAELKAKAEEARERAKQKAMKKAMDRLEGKENPAKEVPAEAQAEKEVQNQI